VCGQLHAPGKEPPGTHWIGGWVGPRAGLDAAVKRKGTCLPFTLRLHGVVLSQAHG